MYYYQNIMPDAIIAYRKAIELNNSSPVYWSNLSLAYMNAANYTEAEKAMSQAVALNGSDEYKQRLDEIKKLSAEK